MDHGRRGRYKRAMRRLPVISPALHALVCLALILTGAAGPLAAAPAGAAEGWLVICGVDGAYEVPAPGAPERSSPERPSPVAPDHADCAMCAAGCAGACGPVCARTAPVAHGAVPDRRGARLLPSTRGPDAPAFGAAILRLRGPPARLPS